MDGKSILITGGTGSFGKAFIRHLLQSRPQYQRIVVFSRDELKQFEMQHQPPFDDSRIRYFIGDVRDRERLHRAFDGVDDVVHAAALKQVPSCEYNPFEAVKTNVIGAQNIIDTAIDRDVSRVVALSTDKACAPINLYGATKLCADKLFIAGNSYVGNHRTTFSVVRYGNVAGSRGSIIPHFQTLIAQGANELPITDRRMTRFWLLIGEAVEMVTTALQDMTGGELYVKKIPSVKITDIAQAIGPGLPIREIGIRPGEKLHEVMITSEDARHTVEYDRYYVILPEFDFRPRPSPVAPGRPVAVGFEYHSGTNRQWLSVADIKRIVATL